MMADDLSRACRSPNSYFLDPPISDDEESFVVLGSSLPNTPDSGSSAVNAIENAQIENNQMIDATAIEEALHLAQAHLSNMSGSSSSFPSMPKVSAEHNLIPMVDKLHISTVTTNSSVDLSPDEIQLKVDLLVDENIKLKETLRQNNLAMKNQYETLVLWQEDVMKVHQSHKEKFEETKKYIENLKIENGKLSDALALQQSKCADSKEIITTYACKSPSELISSNLAEFDLETAQKKISALETEIKLLQTEKLTWEKNYDLRNTLTSQIQNLQKTLDNSKLLHAEEVADYQKQIQQLNSLQKVLLNEISILQSRPTEQKSVTQETLNNVHEQLMAAQMHITKLELLRHQDTESINEKVTVITKLEAELRDCKDTMAALETQLGLYKSDYEAERQARNSLNEEKVQIANDLMQLQRRNNQLLEEVERLRQNDYVHVERLEHAAATSPTAPQENSTKWECPKCSFKFVNYQALENHVYRCLEIDSLF